MSDTGLVERLPAARENKPVAWRWLYDYADGTRSSWFYGAHLPFDEPNTLKPAVAEPLYLRPESGKAETP